MRELCDELVGTRYRPLIISVTILIEVGKLNSCLRWIIQIGKSLLKKRESSFFEIEDG
jgi:hypothetical protein